MKREELQVGLLLRFIGKDTIGVFACSHIWKVVDIEGERVSLSDMKGMFIKSHSLSILKDFEIFTPGDDEPKVKWKTKYLGVVSE